MMMIMMMVMMTMMMLKMMKIKITIVNERGEERLLEVDRSVSLFRMEAFQVRPPSSYYHHQRSP